ncbi:MAG: Transposase DDE domain protein [Actinobacteria bacterium ADurb.BinA094]|nr:MAG: Transposase DDE domain protein [Actinobacteria bacterium ADurb.BinA094]
MDADLDTLCTVVYCTADDLLPEARGNARRKLTDAELVTLCVAQAIMGIPSDRRFLAVARKRLVHLFPLLPGQSGYHKRRRRLAGTIEWLLGVFAAQSPGYYDDLLLVDSTPVPCAQSSETVKRSALGEAAGYGYCAAHTRWYWGFRLHGVFAPDGTPRAITLADPARGEREVALELLERTRREAVCCLVCDKGYAGREFAASAAEQGVFVVRPQRKDEPGGGPHLAPIRQRIESIFWTCKDLLTLERHGARTLAGLRERVLSRFLCLAACISLNHRLGRPSRALVDYCA